MKKKTKVKKPSSFSLWQNNSQSGYVPYIDLKGNELFSIEDIGFTNEELFHEKPNDFEIWGTKKEPKKQKIYTVHSPGVKPIYGDNRNFPVALVSPEGDTLNLKISIKTKEVLPIYAGSCQTLDIAFLGRPAVGKTTYISQLSDPAFHETLSRGLEVSIMESIFGDTSGKSQYEKFLHDLKYEGVFPPPTVFSPNTITPNIYYLTYDDGEPRHCLLRLHDLDGEQCLNIGFNNTALKFKYLYLCVGADELLFGSNNGQHYYKKILSRVLQNLTVKGGLDSCQIMVVITKADLLLKNLPDPCLQPVISNSLDMTADGELVLKSNADGFSYVEFNRRETAIKKFLQKNYPGFYLMLKTMVPGPVHYSMIASIGNAPDKGNTFSQSQYEPFCIDMPIARTLADLGMCKIAVEEDNTEAPKEERVSGLGGNRNKNGTSEKSFFRRFKEKILIHDEDDDEEFEDDTYGEYTR